MTPEERTNRYELQTNELYAGLGEFLATFELIVQSMRTSAYSAQTGQSVHRKLIGDPTANWTAIPARSDHFGAKRRGVNSLLR